MGWSLGWAGLQRTSVREPLTEAFRASAINLAPLGPMPSYEASMEVILLTVLLQTAAKIGPQPSSPSWLFLRLRPPSPMAVSGSLTKILVRWNQLGDKGTTILCDALRESKVTNVQELDLANNGIGPDGAKAVAAMAAVVASLTSVR